jgi:hypothetical protein
VLEQTGGLSVLLNEGNIKEGEENEFKVDSLEEGESAEEFEII